MKILISILLIGLVLIVTSKIKIHVISLKKEKKLSKTDFNIKLGWYILGVVKIAGITLKKDGIHFGKLTIPYGKVKIQNMEMRNWKEISFWDVFKMLDLKFRELEIDVGIGTESVMLTIFSVFVISTFLSIFSARNSEKVDQEKFYYKVSPIYQSNELRFDISAKIEMTLIRFIKVLMYINREAKNKEINKIHIKQKSPLEI